MLIIAWFLVYVNNVFINQQLALFVLRIIIENTKRKSDFNISNLTNSSLLTIGRHYTLTDMHHKSKKALDLQGLMANFQR